MFSFQTKRVVRRRLTAIIFALYRFPSFKLRFNLGVSKYLPINSAAYLACSRSDWVYLRQLLTKGRVNILGRTALGDTLLHIRSLSLALPSCYLMLIYAIDSNAIPQTRHSLSPTPSRRRPKCNQRLRPDSPPYCRIQQNSLRNPH